MRYPAQPRKRTKAVQKSFPAPTGGWVSNQNLAAPDARLPNGQTIRGASVLENWFPTATGIRMRAGSQLYATIGDGSRDVTALFRYANGGSLSFFAATNNAIYPITSPASPTVSPTASVTGLTGGKWSSLQFATSGGVFLRIVNGSDTPRVFDGATWGTTPAITGPTLVSDLSYVWGYASRMFFVQKDSLNAWYLAVDTIGGAATKFPMGGIFQKGGSLLFGANWSLGDTGGLQSTCIFVTTEGEVAVYEGPDPASWALVGVYQIGKPKGQDAWIRAGGDIIIATSIGAVPLSQAIDRDVLGLGLAAISYPIETEWNRLSKERADGWHCAVWPEEQMAVVSYSAEGSQTKELLVANVATGAWSLYKGWLALCLCDFAGRFFFGSAAGQIIEAEVSGADLGTPYTSTCVGMFDDMRSPASLKVSGRGRAVYLAPVELDVRVTVQVNYEIDLDPAPDDVRESNTNAWGSGIWGTAIWGETADKRSFSRWESVSGDGHAIAPTIQVTSGAISPPDVELVRTDLTLSIGGLTSA